MPQKILVHATNMSRNEDSKHLEERYPRFDARNLVAVAAGTIGQVGIECKSGNLFGILYFLTNICRYEATQVRGRAIQQGVRLNYEQW